VARTEVVKKLWDYIKAHNLQDPKDKRAIVADAKLLPVFGKDRSACSSWPASSASTWSATTDPVRATGGLLLRAGCRTGTCVGHGVQAPWGLHAVPPRVLCPVIDP
jgi:hypothetical protein